MFFIHEHAQYKLVLYSGAKLRGFRNTMKSTCVISCVRGAQAFLVMRGAQTGLHNRMDVKLITIKDSRPSYDDTCNLDGNFYHFDLKWVLKLDVGLWELRCRPSDQVFLSHQPNLVLEKMSWKWGGASCYFGLISLP